MFRLPFMGRQRPISPLPAPRREAVEPTVDRISPDIDKGWHALANLPFRGKVVSTQVGCGCLNGRHSGIRQPSLQVEGYLVMSDITRRGFILADGTAMNFR